MFRRMNAYTLPLNDAERRRATFQGALKWFVNRTADHFGALFNEFGIFTNRQTVRMADAELIAELVLAFERGITSSNNTALSGVYKMYDIEFPQEELYSGQIAEAFDFVLNYLGGERGTHLMKP